MSTNFNLNNKSDHRSIALEILSNSCEYTKTYTTIYKDGSYKLSKLGQIFGQQGCLEITINPIRLNFLREEILENYWLDLMPESGEISDKAISLLSGMLRSLTLKEIYEELEFRDKKIEPFIDEIYIYLDKKINILLDEQHLNVGLAYVDKAVRALGSISFKDVHNV